MKIPLVDRGNYYRSLLVLIGKDRIIDPQEHAWMIEFGKELDFDKRFCEAAIRDLLDNNYITDEPAVFSAREIAERFLHDAMRLAAVDGKIHHRELDWIKTLARANGFTDEWILSKMTE